MALADLNRQPRHFCRRDAGAVQVELGLAEPIGPSVLAFHQLGAQHVAIKRVRPLPIANMNHAVVELHRQFHAADLLYTATAYQCPASEVRDTWRHPLTRTSEAK